MKYLMVVDVQALAVFIGARPVLLADEVAIRSSYGTRYLFQEYLPSDSTLSHFAMARRGADRDAGTSAEDASRRLLLSALWWKL